VAPEFPAGPEAVLTQSFPAAVDPTPYELEPVAFATEPVTFEIEPVTFEAESPAYEAVEDDFGFEPVAHEFEPVTFEAEPATLDSSAPTYDLEPEVQVAEPVTFDLVDLVEPVAESFSWSPWAQEMGLGEAAVVTDAIPESFAGASFADMVEDAGGHGHTDAFPVPQAPVDEVPAAEYPPVEEIPAVDPTPVDQVAQFMPQPRDPGDGVVEPSSYAQAVGAHGATPQEVATREAADGPVQAAGGQAESVPDPLAGGLLAHLMSSVRGL
jgi:hypothetical protein